MRRRSFTLVELLLVIGVIAILSGILLPTLAKVKEKVKTTLCIGNNRQLYLGAMGYSNDNNGLVHSAARGYPTDQGLREGGRFRYCGVKTQPGLSTFYGQMIYPKYWMWENCYCPAYPAQIITKYVTYAFDIKNLMPEQSNIPVPKNVVTYVQLFSKASRAATDSRYYQVTYFAPRLEWDAAVVPTDLGMTVSCPPIRLGKYPTRMFVNDMYTLSFGFGNNALSSAFGISRHNWREGSTKCTMVYGFQDGAATTESYGLNYTQGWSIRKEITKAPGRGQQAETHIQTYNAYLMRRDNNDRTWQ